MIQPRKHSQVGQTGQQSKLCWKRSIEVCVPQLFFEQNISTMANQSWNKLLNHPQHGSIDKLNMNSSLVGMDQANSLFCKFLWENGRISPRIPQQFTVTTVGIRS
jgi:hypothetical protein